MRACAANCSTEISYTLCAAQIVVGLRETLGVSNFFGYFSGTNQVPNGRSDKKSTVYPPVAVTICLSLS